MNINLLNKTLRCTQYRSAAHRVHSQVQIQPHQLQLVSYDEIKLQFYQALAVRDVLV